MICIHDKICVLPWLTHSISMKCKLLLRIDLKHTSFQYLIDTVSLLYGNNNKNSLEICDYVKNLDRFQKHEGDE